MPIIDPNDFLRPVLPEWILVAFQGRLYLSLPELARLLEMDKRTLLAQIKTVEGFRRSGATRHLTVRGSRCLWAKLREMLPR
jgi:hypothetical protein